ncbi:hypothetical protein FBQ85_25240 [Cytophagia bacterium CHB2]|nr:hypothetical protein [Cytophagia bacterium CHB2]
MNKNTAPEIATDFDWLVYADATFAGLAILLPFPFVDSWLEGYFRRRMPGDIARRRGRTLSRAAIREVNRTRGEGLLRGCLLWPFEQIIYLIRNMYRTLVYVFTVVDATDKLSHYWHRAFLLDYMILRGHLDAVEQAAIAGEALRRVLETTETSPVRNLAEEIIGFAGTHVRGLIRSTIRFLRRQEETTEFKRKRQTIAERWGEFHDYFVELAGTYEKTLAEVARERQATPQRRA